MVVGALQDHRVRAGRLELGHPAPDLVGSPPGLDRRVSRDVGAADRLPRAAYDVGVGDRVEQHAVADLAGERDGLRAPRADEQPGRLGRRPVERHLVERDVPALHVDGLPGQQRAHRGGVLAQQRHGGVDRGADLAHPVLDAVAERDGEPAREQPGQRGQLHGGQRGVAKRHRQQPDPHRDPLGPGQCRGGAWSARPRGSSPQTATARRRRPPPRIRPRTGAARAGTGVGTPHRSSCRRLCQRPGRAISAWFVRVVLRRSLLRGFANAYI